MLESLLSEHHIASSILPLCKTLQTRDGTLEGMAQEKQKQPGRIRQMVQVYNTTRKHDRALTPLMLLSFLAPIAAGVIVALSIRSNWIGWIVWVLTGVLVGLLIAMIILGRRAEHMAYSQIEGRPGAVGAVIQSALRRSWRGSEVPISMNRQQDAVYRVVGRGGVVLISEGSRQRTQRMAKDEERKVRRALMNVEIVHLYVGPDEGSVPLPKLSNTLVKLKPQLSRSEVHAVFNRLSSLQSSPVGIPKGMDPNKIRAGRPR